MYSAIATTRFILGINPNKTTREKLNWRIMAYRSTYGFHTEDEWL